jgi:hypothetical protein
MEAPMRPAVALEGGLVLVWQTKCLVVLEPAEILGLLRHDPQVWARAIRRGKAHRRGEAMARRTGDRAPAQATEDATHSSEPLTSSQPGHEPG